MASAKGKAPAEKGEVPKNLHRPEGRFYEAKYPEADDLVLVQVKRIAEMGAYVSLLEYENIEGMILHSELSKRRIRSIAKLVKVGRTEVAMVVRTDEEKGYIDLSKRRVALEDVPGKEAAFAKAKAVHGIMRHVASLNDINVEKLCMCVAWPLQKKYENAHEAFRKHINDEIDIWKDPELNFDALDDDEKPKVEKIKADIEIDLRRRLIAQELRLRAKIEVACSEYEGIDAVKAALLAGQDASHENAAVKITLIAHPLFLIVTKCVDKELGVKTIDEAMKLIEDSITSKGGTFVAKSRPEVVGADEKDGPDSDSDSEGSKSNASSGDRSDMGDLDVDMDAFKKQTDDKVEKGGEGGDDSD